MGRILIKGGVWRNTEDEILKAAVMKYGKNQWSRIASLLHRKSAKQCKARWFEWLDPSIKKTEWSREEEEKLINLVRLMPTQWRTIASIVGRTASQCLEHYEQLLDQVQNKEKDSTIEDPRKLKPGEIDPNPETKPARPDPKDMDEDELEMLSEARARLANTQGKKAKRKAREKQLEEARRLASLQKRRELRMAGINMQIRNHKFKRYIDYNNEIPFEKPVPAGFHDTVNDVYDPAGHDFKRLRQQQLDGELPSEREERERKKDKQKLKQKKENGMPTSLLKQNEVVRPRSKLVLPEPAISESEIEQVVKLGKVSELARETATESGNVASGTLLADYAINTTINNIRTPKNPVLSRDNILMEAQNLIALTNVDTPLKGGSNVPLIDVPDISTPAGINATMTPNTMISTPFRSVHGKGGVGNTPSRTPTIGSQEGFSTPLSTPLRDKLAINPEESMIFDSAQDSKRQNKEMRENLRKAFADLPKPRNEYEIVLNNENKQNDVDDEDGGGNVEMLDQSELDEQQQLEQKAKIMKEQKWSKAVQRDVPRPTDVRSTLLMPSTNGGLLSQAEDLIKEEMLKMLHFDALMNPAENQQTYSAIYSMVQSKNQSNKSYENTLAEYLHKNPLDSIDDKSMAVAEKLLNNEMEQVKDAMGHGDISDMDYSSVWDECYSQLLYVPAQNRYTKAKIVYKNEHIKALESRLEQSRLHMAKEAKRAAKLEKKISILLGGYHSRVAEMHKHLQNNVNDIEQARLELYSFKALNVCEDRAIQKRIKALEDDVNKQNLREKQLQQRYDDLVRRKEELSEH